MGHSLWLFLLVVCAIAIGWVLGSLNPWRRLRIGQADGRRQYYRGLNYLLNDQPDEAIDAFINSLDVSEETLDTHLAVGNLMRRKGEVERAIRIHQNLLSRPSLGQEQLQQAHLELARDFMSAGLLDRAERLLQDLSAQSSALRETSLRLLMEVYQGEREWERAIETARSLLPRRSLLRSASVAERGILATIAQYQCEQAEGLIQCRDFPRARSILRQALSADRGCARASLLLGRLELACGQPGQALRAFHRLRQQDPALLGEILPELQAVYRDIGQPEAYRDFLEACLLEYPSTTLLLAVVDHLRSERGHAASLDYLAQRLRQRPTLRGVSRLIELNLATGLSGTGESGGEIALLQTLVQQLLSIKPAYQCHQCGFSGRSLHWLCPSCKQWNTIRPIRGVEGD